MKPYFSKWVLSCGLHPHKILGHPPPRRKAQTHPRREAQTQQVCPLDVSFNYFMRAILQYVMIVLKGSVPISFGGTEEPADYGELVSIGGLSSDVNKKLSSAISTILLSKLSVPKSPFFLKFYDVQASHLNI